MPIKRPYMTFYSTTIVIVTIYKIFESEIKHHNIYLDNEGEKRNLCHSTGSILILILYYQLFFNVDFSANNYIYANLDTNKRIYAYTLTARDMNRISIRKICVAELPIFATRYLRESISLHVVGYSRQARIPLQVDAG